MLRIEDSHGAQVLEIVPNGPIFLAKVQPGEYVIQVDAEDQTLTRRVTVPASGQEAVAMTWPGGDQPSRSGDAPSNIPPHRETHEGYPPSDVPPSRDLPME